MNPPNEGEAVGCGAVGVRLRGKGDSCGLVSIVGGTDGDFVRASNIGLISSVSGSFLMMGSSSRI